MATLALCMIVKNEKDTLPNCLKSVNGIFDEIIIVDTGSTDETRDVARGFTDNVFDFEWTDDFAAARNRAFELSESDYLMWLDADDVILPEDAIKLKELKNSLDGKIVEIAAKYNVGFDESGAVTLDYYRERIFLKSAGLKWCGRVHETIPILRDCVYADFAVTHRKTRPTERGRNLRIYEKMLADGVELDARNTYYYARELYYCERFEEAACTLKKFLGFENGFVENKIDACAILAECTERTGENPLPYLFKSFEYDSPRAEICCAVGKHFFDLRRNKEAIYWYEEALRKEPHSENGAFVYRDCYGFIPLMQLCVLYYAAGDTEKAKKCNESAAKLKPFDKAVLFNKDFFKENK